MSDSDVLVSIPPHEWTQLRDMYSANWPVNEIAYNTIENYIHWQSIDAKLKDIDIVSLNGTWRQDGTCIVCDRYEIFVYTLEESSLGSLGRALELLDWDYGYKVCNFSERFRSSIEAIIAKFNLQLLYDQPTYTLHLPKEQALEFDIRLPSGLQLGTLSKEHAITANKLWPYSCIGSDFFLQRLAAWNPNVGLFDEQGALVGWCFYVQSGALGILQVADDHLRRGYGTILTKAMSKKLAEMGRNPCAFVSIPNTISLAMFTKLGFKVVEQSGYIRTKPRKLVEWEC